VVLIQLPFLRCSLPRKAHNAPLTPHERTHGNGLPAICRALRATPKIKRSHEFSETAQTIPRQINRIPTECQQAWVVVIVCFQGFVAGGAERDRTVDLLNAIRKVAAGPDRCCAIGLDSVDPQIEGNQRN